MNSQLPKKQSIISVLKASYLQDFDGNTKYDLIITIQSTDISFRELGAFLLIVDRFYGRLESKNFNSYSLTERQHLKISDIEQGSTLFIIKDFLEVIHADNAIILLLLIKFLKSALKSGSEALVKVSKAYQTYEKSRLTRFIRQSLKEDIREDEILGKLSDKDLSKLVNLLEKKYTNEKKFLSAASKFARKKIKNVELKKN